MGPVCGGCELWAGYLVGAGPRAPAAAQLKAGAGQGLTQPGWCLPGHPWLSATSMEVMSPLLTSPQ